jgi:hypothetical protein
VDHTTGIDTTVETVEKPPAPDRGPPPDQPGAESEGVSSRADSRAGAAAANNETQASEQSAEQSAKDKPSTNQPAEGREDSPTTAQSYEQTTPTSKQTAEGAEQRAASDSPTEPFDRSTVEQGYDSEVEQQPSMVGASPGATTASENEEAPEQAEVAAESTNQPTPTASRDRDLGEQPVLDESPAETADTQPRDRIAPFDDPGNEPEGVSSRADSRVGAAAANANAVTDTADTKEPLLQAEDTARAAENLNGRSATRDTADQSGKEETSTVDSFDAATSTHTTQDAQQASETPQPDVDGDPAGRGSSVAESETVDETPVVEPNKNDGQAGAVEDQAQKLEPISSAAERQGEGGTRPDETTEDEEHDPALEFTIEDKLVRAYDSSDLAHDQDRSQELGEEPLDPTDRRGDRIVKDEEDKDSRFERLRKRIYEESEDVIGAGKELADTAKDLLETPRPTGSYQKARPRDEPKVTISSDDGIDAGDAFAGAAVLFAVSYEGARWAVEHWRGRKKEEKEE